MTEEANNPSSPGSVMPTGDQPATGTAPGGATPPAATPTVEELLKELAELKHAHGNAKEEVERHRKKLSTFEKAEAEREQAKKAAEEAQLSELEKLNKRYAELQSQHTEYSRQMQERVVRYEVEKQARALGIIDEDAAAKLLDWSELEYDDSGTPHNAKKLLEKLIKNKPYLAPPVQQQQTPNAQQPPLQGSARQQAPLTPAMNPGRTQIAQPGSNPPGRIPRLSDRGIFVPPGTPSKYQP